MRGGDGRLWGASRGDARRRVGAGAVIAAPPPALPPTPPPALPPALPADPGELARIFAAPAGAAPFLRIGLVSSANGGAADESGWTASLGGPGDRRMLRALRAVADVVLMGSGTARTGKVPYPRVHPEFAAHRPRDAAGERPRVVVLSRTGDIDASAALFHGPEPAIVATTQAGAAALARRGAPVETHVAESGESIGAQIRRLCAEAGFRSALCEGGPRLAGAILDDGAADELCLTLAPALLPAGVPHWLTGRTRVDMTLRRVFHDSGSLFVSYGIARPPG